jgi:hypothetical protein
VERPKPICPKGCNVIEQWRWNTTVNRTQLFTKCSCRAGNQPCPSTWTACTCYEGLNSQNLTRGFVVCSETQGECDRKCNLAVSGNPRLAPLCPIAMDPFLSITPTAPPIYPMFGWNIASQAASQAATLGVAGRSLKQLVGLGRRLMAAADWQVQKLMLNAPTAVAGDQRVSRSSSSSSSSSSSGGGGGAPAAAPEAMSLQTWLQRVCASVNRAVWGQAGISWVMGATSSRVEACSRFMKQDCHGKSGGVCFGPLRLIWYCHASIAPTPCQQSLSVALQQATV